ncbi:MAG: cytochrome c biogenesis protein CcdA [Albidovulum sp.]|nr:cytochrome c biogenesis protein CcdA [Albidovulum sp.]MDE0531251.1 cytochrome c biogenesis protein CcdA [Albidovulum sp.]
MFGIDIIDATIAPAIIISLLAGSFSFVSPCVLPIVPPYLAYMGGISFADLSQGRRRAKIVTAAAFFVLGLSTVFLLLGFTVSTLGLLFLEYQTAFGRVAGIVVLVFGLHFIGVFRIPLLDREARFDVRRGSGAIGSFVLGLAFAFGWVPCIGPQLGAILTLAAQESSVARGTILLGAYAFGLGIPFVLAALFINESLGLMQKLKSHLRKVEFGIGSLLVLVGLLLLTGNFSDISFWLLSELPFLALVG